MHTSHAEGPKIFQFRKDYLNFVSIAILRVLLIRAILEMGANGVRRVGVGHKDNGSVR